MSAVYTVGQVLPSGATVVSDTYVTADDGSTTETMVDSRHNVIILGVPGAGTPAANAATINADILARQTTLANWISANPSGAVLTAAQTLVVAEMLNGLCKLLLGQFSSAGGT